MNKASLNTVYEVKGHINKKITAVRRNLKRSLNPTPLIKQVP